jgi:deazaflavin-dependent oxidoreductase (nitroreductase family)
VNQPDKTHRARVARLLRRLGDRPGFVRVSRRLVPIDRALGRLTRGRLVALHIDGLPSLLITTTGRRTGRPRTNPLLYATDGADFVVVGSNWGQPEQPAWSTNLVADPIARVTLAGERIPVRAQLVTGAERDRLWRLLVAIWPAYDSYLARAAGRQLRVFRLSRIDVPG